MRVATVSTRRLTGLDYRVWLLMALCWVACAGWFVYKKIIPTKAADCSTLQITVNGDGSNRIAVCKLDETAFFQIDAPTDAKVEWNFGDGTKTVGDNLTGHKFKDEDAYTVTATVNGLCETKRDVTVRKVLAGDAVKPSVKIFADTGRTVGSRIRFSALANIPVDSCRWSVLPTNETQVGENVAFNFTRAGQFTVQVTVNNDPAIRQEQKITITDVPLAIPANSNPNPGNFQMPQPNPPAGPWDASNTTAPKLSTPKSDTTLARTTPSAVENIAEANPETFKGLLQDVLNGDKKIAELYRFLKYEGSTQVEVNKKPPFMSLDDFCSSKRGKKIKAIDFIRQKDNPKYIQTIKVEVKSGIWPFG